MPSKSLFPQSCLSSGCSMVVLMVTSSKRTYAMPRCAALRESPCPCGRPLLTHDSAGYIQTLRGRSGSVSVGSLGPGVHTLLLIPSEHLWKVWDLILIEISPLLPSCWGFYFALGCAVSSFGGIQHSPVNDCSAARCNFGVLAEDRCMSSYSAMLFFKEQELFLSYFKS